jgi:hypothetical protein
LPGLSRDAHVVVFGSLGQNLVPNDTNGVSDIFLRTCLAPTSYCTAKRNSLGCLPSVGTTGVPMASWPTGFTIDAERVLNQKQGMLIYSTAGAAAVPFAGGTLCLQGPLQRTPVQGSGGTPGAMNCTGTFSLDFNAWIASGANPALVAGATVWAQYWSRDPGFAPPDNVSLTDATTFVIRP